jgi:hypothetical protein
VQSTVFTTTDYQQLTGDGGYLKTVQLLFALATVVFVGYSVRDEYVLNLFVANCGARPLFGDGPHFLVSSNPLPGLPDSIKKIRYVPEPHADHRSAISVLDIVRVVRDGGHVWFAPENAAAPKEEKRTSAYFISDIVAEGVWTTSLNLELGGGPDKPSVTRNAIVGQGFDETELLEKTSPAMHDLTVGLISFDYVYVPLARAGKLHDLLGSALFWDLVKNGVFRFIYFECEPVVMFQSAERVDGGDVGEIHFSTEDGGPLTMEEQTRKQFRSAPGRESEVEQLYALLQANVFTFDRTRFNIPNLTRGALLHPSVRSLLGISDAVLPTSFPRWVRFPVLRLAHTIMAGCACEDFTLPATKIGFGSEILVGAAFAASAARDWTDSVSSYVLTGRFNTDLGAYVQSNLPFFYSTLKFRDTQEGIDLRREVLEELATNAGSEFVASVNAGLKRLVPSQVMESARDQLSGLLLRSHAESPVVPAVWTNIRNSDSIARLWRARSKRELDDYCRSRGIREGSLCPCGSGDKLRYCCAQALSDR